MAPASCLSVVVFFAAINKSVVGGEGETEGGLEKWPEIGGCKKKATRGYRLNWFLSQNVVQWTA